MSGIKALLGKFSKVSRSNKKTEQKATTVNTSTEGYANFRQTHLHKCHTRHATTTVISTTNSTNELSLLFIIIDSLPHEEIWKKWLASSGNGSGTCTGAHIATATNDDVVPIIHILIHAKYPHKVTSPWVRERLVTSFQYEPAWGSVDIAKVMIGLLKEMLDKHPAVHKLCFVSETCIPILPLDAFCHILGRDNNSWVKYYNDVSTGYAFQKQFEPVIASGFPREVVCKSDQWVALSAQHAAEIVALPAELYGHLPPTASSRSTSGTSDSGDSSSAAGAAHATAGPPDTRLLQRVFGRVHSPDEVYMASCLGLLGHLLLLSSSASNSASNSSAKITGASGAGSVIANVTTGTTGTTASAFAAHSSRSTPQPPVGCRCRSGVLRKCTTYVKWPDNWKNSVHPVCFSTLTPELLQQARTHNRRGVDQAKSILNPNDNISTSTLISTSSLSSTALHSDSQCPPDFSDSALFLRKIKTDSVEAQEELLNTWSQLVLPHVHRPAPLAPLDPLGPLGPLDPLGPLGPLGPLESLTHQKVKEVVDKKESVSSVMAVQLPASTATSVVVGGDDKDLKNETPPCVADINSNVSNSDNSSSNSSSKKRKIDEVTAIDTSDNDITDGALTPFHGINTNNVSIAERTTDINNA